MSIVLDTSMGKLCKSSQQASISTGFFGGMMQCTCHLFTSAQSYPAGLSSTTPATRSSLYVMACVRYRCYTCPTCVPQNHQQENCHTWHKVSFHCQLGIVHTACILMTKLNYAISGALEVTNNNTDGAEYSGLSATSPGLQSDPC